ncbi:hypothetical protein JCM24511_03140 [Saitozyma sp. JCM 24511]|nr:hypothetical protein JCM24511_03140 [Saitozyma sp. JCM 24511]
MSERPRQTEVTRTRRPRSTGAQQDAPDRITYIVTEANTYEKSQAEYDDDLELIGRAFRNTDIPFDPSVEFEFEIDNANRTITYVSRDSTLIMGWEDPSETRRLGRSNTDPGFLDRESLLDIALEEIRSERMTESASLRVQSGRGFLEYDLAQDTGKIGVESRLGVTNYDMKRSEVAAIREAMRDAGWGIP